MTESRLQLLLIMAENMSMKVCRRIFMRAFPRPKAKGNIFTKTLTIDTIIREASKKFEKKLFTNR